jgi:ribosomal protein S15P/S13E
MWINPKFNLFKKKKKVANKSVNEKSIKELIDKELSVYITKEGLQNYLKEIERDKNRRRIWNGLSQQKKLKLLRYLKSKGGINNEKTVKWYEKPSIGQQ